jgi:hypothetical protein
MKNLAKKLIVFFFWFPGFIIYGQDSSFFKRLDYFPEKRIFPLIYLDPLTCQTYGGIHVMFEEGNKKKGIYVPVNLGFSKPFFAFENGKAQFQLGLEAASYIQFEIVHLYDNTYLGGLYNNDYKVNAYITAKTIKWHYRFQFFHISSHLGDDYMIRNEDFSRNDKSVNYEQIDFMVMKREKGIDAYAGFGYVFTPNAFRKRLSAQLGFQFDKDYNRAYHLVGGLDLKSFQQNNYYPNIRIAIGPGYFKEEKPVFRLLLEFYHGHLPYSTHEYRKPTWIGLSSVIHI